MRLDKFLKVSRIIKRRTVANEAASGGRVLLNGKEVKPSHDVKVGDILEIKFGEQTIDDGEVNIRIINDQNEKQMVLNLFQNNN